MFEAYAVGVRLSLIDKVTTGLMGIARQFHKVHGDATALQAKLERIKLLTLGGAALTGTGMFGLHLIGKTLPDAKEYVHQLTQMNIAGMKHAEIVKATAAAWGAAKAVPTSTASENLAAVRELRMVFGDTGHAIANMPAVQRLQYILENTKGGHGRGQDEAYTVAKALEMKGAVRTPGEFMTQADMMAKAIVASGGKVNANDFLNTFKYGRSATLGWNDAFAYTILPTLIQEMKASGGSGGAGGPGNALMSVYDKVINGKIAQKDLGIWAQLGLLDSSKIVRTKTGSAKGVLPGGVAGWELFQQDPYSWTQNVLMKSMREHGITNPAQQQMFLSRLGGTRTAGFMLQQLGMQGWKFERDMKLIRGAKGLNAYDAMMKSDPMAVEVALHKQWKNLLTIIGFQIMPAIIKGSLFLIDVLRPITDFARRHPTITKTLVILFAALSGLAVIAGTVLLFAGAIAAVGLALPVVAPLFAVLGAGILALGWPIALAIGIFAALGTAIYFLHKHWKDIVPKLQAVWNGILGGVGAFINGLHALIPQIPMFPGTKGGPPLKHYPKAFGLPGSPNQTGQHPLRQWLESFGGHHRAGGISYVHPAGASGGHMVGDVHMDGHKVGQVLWRHQAKELARPPAGGAAYDAGMQLTPVGAGYFSVA